MRAAQINTYGDASAVEITDIPQPKPSNDQVLVEVHAASLNPFDTLIRDGKRREQIPLSLPVTLGGDLAGVVVEAPEASGFAPGDRVYGQANVVAGNSGSFAEYAATAPAQLALAPNNLNFTDAASLPLVGVSALQALTEHLGLQPGQKIFIHGGAGGIGSVAIQLAKHLGAHIATTASGDDIDYVTQLGADKVIDYKTTDFAETLQGYDAVFDTVGGDDFAKSYHTLKPGGIAVSMIAPPDEALAAELGITALTQGTHVTTERLDKLRELIEGGVIAPHVGKVYPLDSIREAFEARETGAVRGKVVLAIRS